MTNTLDIFTFFESTAFLNEVNEWYRKNIACSERSFQFAVAKIIEEKFGDYKVLIEPGFVCKNEGAKNIETSFRPDIVITDEENKIISCIELKFNPACPLSATEIKNDLVKLNDFNGEDYFVFDLYGANLAQRENNPKWIKPEIDENKYSRFELKNNTNNSWTPTYSKEHQQDRLVFEKHSKYKSIFCFLSVLHKKIDQIDSKDKNYGFNGLFENKDSLIDKKTIGETIIIGLGLEPEIKEGTHEELTLHKFPINDN